MRPVLLKGVFVVVAGLLGACSGTHETLNDRPTSAALAPVVPVLNVPSLLSLSIDEMSRRVGPPQRVPASFNDPTLAPLLQRNEQLDSTALFRCQGLAIVVSYDYQSRQVSDLLLLGTDESQLMGKAQLEIGAEHYLVLPVFQAKPPTELLGLRVLATKPTIN